ncbi:hypothetical protein ACFS07_23875 [Undibacterium arcticum]
MKMHATERYGEQEKFVILKKIKHQSQPGRQTFCCMQTKDSHCGWPLENAADIRRAF